VYQEAFEILVERQNKYGSENISSQGVYGVVTRIGDDKLNRIRRALNGKVVNGRIILDPIPEGESTDTFEDAALDIANYALITLGLHRGLWGRPLEMEL
jgi:hypothetical protein